MFYQPVVQLAESKMVMHYDKHCNKHCVENRPYVNELIKDIVMLLAADKLVTKDTIISIMLIKHFVTRPTEHEKTKTIHIITLTQITAVSRKKNTHRSSSLETDSTKASYK